VVSLEAELEKLQALHKEEMAAKEEERVKLEKELTTGRKSLFFIVFVFFFFCLGFFVLLHSIFHVGGRWAWEEKGEPGITFGLSALAYEFILLCSCFALHSTGSTLAEGYNGQIQALESQLASKAQALEAITAIHQQGVGELDKAQQELKQLQASDTERLERLREQLEQAEGAVKEAGGQVARLTASEAELKLEVAKAEKAQNELKMKATSLETEVQKLQKELDLEKLQHQADMEDFQEMEAHYTQKEEGWKATESEFETSLTAQEKLVEEQVGRVQDLLEEQGKLKAAKEAKEAELLDLTQKLQAAEKGAVKLRAEVDKRKNLQKKLSNNVR